MDDGSRRSHSRLGCSGILRTIPHNIHSRRRWHMAVRCQHDRRRIALPRRRDRRRQHRSARRWLVLRDRKGGTDRHSGAASRPRLPPRGSHAPATEWQWAQWTQRRRLCAGADRPGGRGRRPRYRCRPRDRRRRYQRRLGERGIRPRQHGSSRTPGRADRRRCPGLRANRRRRQRRLTRVDAMARRRRCRCVHLVPRTRDGRCVGRRLGRRRRAARQAAGVVPGPSRRHPGVRTPPRPQRGCQLPRGPPHRIPVVRHGRPCAAVPLRFRSRIRRRVHHRCPGRGRCITTGLDRGRSVERQRPRRHRCRPGLCRTI